MVRNIIEGNRFIEFLDFMADQIYFDLDNILLLFKQGGCPGIQLTTFKTLQKLNVDPNSCKPYVVYQDNIVSDELKKNKVILFDVSNNIKSDKEERFDKILNTPDLKLLMINEFKSKTGFSIMEDDIGTDFYLDLENQVLIIKKDISIRTFYLSVIQAYAENLLFERIEDYDDTFTSVLCRLVVKSITDKNNLKAVAVSKIKDITDDRLIELLNGIQDIVLTTLWDLYEKRFTWKEIMLLHTCCGTKEEIVDYFANFDLNLVGKIDSLNGFQLGKLQNYLKNGLTVFPVCRM